MRPGIATFCCIWFLAATFSSSILADAPKPGPLAEPKPVDQPSLPRDLYAASIPADNPQTPDKIALGKKLFFEPRLSADNSTACATCHDPDKGFTDQFVTSKGIRNQFGHRNAPTILNAIFNVTQFWDGRAPSLEEQAKLPILNPIEMGQKAPGDVVAKLGGIAEYRDDFQKVFGRAPDYGDMAKAIAAYERTQVTFDTPFDRFLAGDEAALNAAARRGWTIFNGEGRCMTCHAVNPSSPMFTDNLFHNIGVAAHKPNFVELARKGIAIVQQGNVKQIDELALQTDLSELGRFLVTKRTADIGAFKTSGLRNVLLTHPYFHDGSQDTLWDTIDHYNKGGVQNPFLDGGIQRLGLTEPEIDDLVAFLASLTSDHYAAAAAKEFARQQALSRTTRPQRDTAAAMGINAQGPGLKGPFGDVAPNPTEEDPARIGGR
jgi:cytochrome c peroxidase